MQRAMTNTTKAATDYLGAFGATAISIIETEGYQTVTLYADGKPVEMPVL
jgi:hypothetical protein